jgi:hypothetical protein
MRATVFLLALAIAACGDGGTDLETPSADGAWRGTLESFPATMRVNITEAADGTISGSGAIYAGTETLSFTLSGTHRHPNVSFDMDFLGFEPAAYSGRFESDDAIRGAIDGSGFTDERVTLSRE